MRKIIIYPIAHDHLISRYRSGTTILLFITIIYSDFAFHNKKARQKREQRRKNSKFFLI